MDGKKVSALEKMLFKLGNRWYHAFQTDASLKYVNFSVRCKLNLYCWPLELNAGSDDPRVYVANSGVEKVSAEVTFFKLVNIWGLA